MAKKKTDTEGDEPKKISSYTIKLDEKQMGKLGSILKEKGWKPFEVAYSRFAYKGDDCNVTAYTSGKVVVAGKGTEDFVRYTIESEVTGQVKLGYDEVLHPDWYEAHAGLDESGKGDFFGPVVAATVIASKECIADWVKAGVRDSKTITDNRILELDDLIRKTPGATVRTVLCSMPKYNEILSKPSVNLNRLLAWQHAKALSDALSQHWVPWGLLDQFTEQPIVQRELAKMGVKNFELRMRTKAEEDPVVAAASVVARAEYVRQMKALSERFGDKLQKGASAKVKEQAADIIARFGARALGTFAKLHFRTAYEVVSAAGKLDELPLKEPGEKVDWGEIRRKRAEAKARQEASDAGE